MRAGAAGLKAASARQAGASTGVRRVGGGGGQCSMMKCCHPGGALTSVIR